MQSDTNTSTRGRAHGLMQGHSNGSSEGEESGIARNYDYLAIIPNTINRSSSRSQGSSEVDTTVESTMDSLSSSTAHDAHIRGIPILSVMRTASLRAKVSPMR